MLLALMISLKMNQYLHLRGVSLNKLSLRSSISTFSYFSGSNYWRKLSRVSDRFSCSSCCRLLYRDVVVSLTGAEGNVCEVARDSCSLFANHSSLALSRSSKVPCRLKQVFIATFWSWQVKLTNNMLALAHSAKSRISFVQ